MTAEKEEVKSIWTKMGRLDYRIIYTIVAIMVAIPVWIPLGIPLKVHDNVINYAEAINALEPGAVVFCSFSGYATMLPDVEPIYMATWKMLLERDVKFLIMLGHVDSPSIIQFEFAKLKPWIDKNNKQYGVDWMIFPFWELTEAALIGFLENMRSQFSQDFYGYSLDDEVHLPMMKNINSAHDIDLVITGSPEYYTRRFYVPYGIRMICWGTGTDLLPFVSPFYGTSVIGYVGGASQGGELEVYTGYLGEGIKYNDAKNLALIGLMIFIVVGNIVYFGEKYSKR